jgi:hypothetical protein
MEETLKFFILDSKARELELCKNRISWHSLLEDAADRLGIETRFKVSKQKGLRDIPRGYDSYLIHLSDTEQESIEELKERQPWSKIYGLNGGGQSTIYQACFDAVYHHLSLLDAQNIVKQTKEIYSKD